jgi:hypothetical protein
MSLVRTYTATEMQNLTSALIASVDRIQGDYIEINLIDGTFIRVSA